MPTLTGARPATLYVAAATDTFSNIMILIAKAADKISTSVPMNLSTATGTVQAGTRDVGSVTGR